MSLRTIRRRRWSEPPRSATGWIERTLLMRVAVNAEQLLQPSPGGIGRYTARLVTLLGAGTIPDEVLTFVARHRPVPSPVRGSSPGSTTAPGVAQPAVLGLPRPVLYDALARARLSALDGAVPGTGRRRDHPCPVVGGTATRSAPTRGERARRRCGAVSRGLFVPGPMVPPFGPACRSPRGPTS